MTLGLWAGGRFSAADIIPYWIAQVIGAIVAAAAIYVIGSGNAEFTLATGFAANGFGAHSPGYSLTSAIVVEVLLTFFFLLIFLGTTDSRAPLGFAPLAIGLGLTLIHLDALDAASAPARDEPNQAAPKHISATKQASDRYQVGGTSLLNRRTKATQLVAE